MSTQIPKMKKGKSGSAAYVPTKQSKLPYIIGGLIILIVIAVIAALIWSKVDSRNKQQAQTVNEGTSASVIYEIGSAHAPHTIDVYEDFLCPICGEFEQRYGKQMSAAANDGKLRVRFHMLHFLDAGSPSKTYSSRAAAATLALAQSDLPAKQKQEAFEAFHTALFREQPAEGGKTDHSNEQLAEIMQQAGKSVHVTIPNNVLNEVKSGAKVAEANKRGDAGIKYLGAISTTGQAGTPTVLEGKKDLNALSNPNWLQDLLKS